MTRPDFTDIRPEVAQYITSLEQDTEQKQQALGQRDERIAQLEIRVADMMQMLENLQRMYFGKKSEKIRMPMLTGNGVEQLSMFEDLPASSEPAVQEQDASASVEVASHKRKKKRTQEEIIADLPQIIHEHTLPTEEQHCPRCGNEHLEPIGKELVHTEYIRVPAHVDRHDHYVYKYACRACAEGSSACSSCDHADDANCRDCPDKPGQIILTADLPEEHRFPLIKGSKASASIFAQILYDKFVQGIPLYRMEKEWERLGFPLSRQTMTNWALKVDKEYLRAMVAFMVDAIKAESHVVHYDETSFKVISEKTEKGNLKKCQMWVLRSGKWEAKQLVVFHYRASRAGRVPVDLLDGYKEYFVSDGYSGYNELALKANRCGCWAHVRRKFYDAIPGHDMSLPSTGREGVRYCDKLFRIEEGLEEVAPQERLRVRNEQSRKVVREFYDWLNTLDPGTSALREAVGYSRNQRQHLEKFLEDGRIPLSNNAAENAIRPFVVGRKNWLFCNTPDGAAAAADIFSLVETAKANDLDILKYLTYLFVRLPMAQGNFSDAFLNSLMPWNLSVRSACKRGYI